MFAGQSKAKKIGALVVTVLVLLFVAAAIRSGSFDEVLTQRKVLRHLLMILPLMHSKEILIRLMYVKETLLRLLER